MGLGVKRRQDEREEPPPSSLIMVLGAAGFLVTVRCGNQGNADVLGENLHW